VSDTRFTERLTRGHAALLLVDHQVGLASGVHDVPLTELKHNVAALTKAAQVLNLPIVVTTTAADSTKGGRSPSWPRCCLPISPASTAPPSTPGTSRGSSRRPRDGAQEAHRHGDLDRGPPGLPTVSATADGFDCYAAVDASGTFSRTKGEAGCYGCSSGASSRSTMPQRSSRSSRTTPTRWPPPSSHVGVTGCPIPSSSLIGLMAVVTSWEVPDGRIGDE
jgi:hypothetical protein